METLRLSERHLHELIAYLGDFCAEMILKPLPIEETHEIERWQKQRNATAADTIHAAHFGELARMAAVAGLHPLYLWLLKAGNEGQLLARAVASIRRNTSNAYRMMLHAKAEEAKQIDVAKVEADPPALPAPEAETAAPETATAVEQSSTVAPVTEEPAAPKANPTKTDNRAEALAKVKELLLKDPNYKTLTHAAGAMVDNGPAKDLYKRDTLRRKLLEWPALPERLRRRKKP